jgi:hypothetical protein
MACHSCNDGIIVFCPDDMCRGAGYCMHGDGQRLCECELYGDDDDAELVRCRCGRESCAEACDQCGYPLCPMCFETGGGFCDQHPDDDYEPPDGTHCASGPKE